MYSRQIIRAAIVPLTFALVFRSTGLHAAWDLHFPFYHGERTIPADAQPPVVSKPANPEPLQPPVTEPPLPVTPVAAPPVSLQAPPSPPIIIIQPPETPKPADVSVAPAEGQPARLIVAFTDALRVTGATYREDVSWQGKVLLDGWITVAPQATLTVAPGTAIRMSRGSGIHVLGRIDVKGTAANPVLVTSLNQEPLAGDWRGIVLSGSEKKNSFEHVRIEGAETALLARFSSFSASGISIGRAITGLRLQESVISISDGRVSDNDSGIVADNSELTLGGVLIENNRNGISLHASSLLSRDLNLANNGQLGLAADASQLKLERFIVSGSETGARITKGEGTVTGSIFRGNSEAGAVLTACRIRLNDNRFTGNGIGLQTSDNMPVLWNNALVDNKSYNLLYLGEEMFYVGGNWFGSAGSANSERTVFSKHAGAVRTEPLLEADPLPVH